MADKKDERLLIAIKRGKSIYSRPLTPGGTAPKVITSEEARENKRQT